MLCQSFCPSSTCHKTNALTWGLAFYHWAKSQILVCSFKVHVVRSWFFLQARSPCCLNEVFKPFIFKMIACEIWYKLYFCGCYLSYPVCFFLFLFCNHFIPFSSLFWLPSSSWCPFIFYWTLIVVHLPLCTLSCFYYMSFG